MFWIKNKSEKNTLNTSIDCLVFVALGPENMANKTYWGVQNLAPVMHMYIYIYKSIYVLSECESRSPDCQIHVQHHGFHGFAARMIRWYQMDRGRRAWGSNLSVSDCRGEKSGDQGPREPFFKQGIADSNSGRSGVFLLTCTVVVPAGLETSWSLSSGTEHVVESVCRGVRLGAHT